MPKNWLFATGRNSIKHICSCKAKKNEHLRLLSSFSERFFADIRCFLFGWKHWIWLPVCTETTCVICCDGDSAIPALQCQLTSSYTSICASDRQLSHYLYSSTKALNLLSWCFLNPQCNTPVLSFIPTTILVTLAGFNLHDALSGAGMCEGALSWLAVWRTGPGVTVKCLGWRFYFTLRHLASLTSH